MPPDDRNQSDEPDEADLDSTTSDADGVEAAPAYVGDIPARIGNYRIIRQIGVGGMGRVFQAIQQFPRRVVALKILSPRFVETPEAMSRFQREAQLLGRLNHPNIAVIHEAGTFELDGRKSPYFAMELIVGARPLTEYASAARLGLDTKLRLLLDACEAVAHAHARGVTHRDIKPSNLPVDRDGRLRLIDFGIARGAESAADLTVMQAPQGRVMGTLRYMGPEQIEGRNELVDYRSDVFSLGVVGYELLCGRLPFPIGAFDDVTEIREIMSSPANTPPPPSHWIPELPESVDAVILQALSLQPSDRFATARQMADALATAIRRTVDRTAVDALPQPRSVALRSHPMVVAAVAALLCTALAMALRTPTALRWIGGAWFERWTATWAQPGVSPQEFARNVAILAITDETDLEGLARRWNHPDPPQVLQHAWALRALHGTAIPLLASAGARAIVFDVAFEGARPTDEAFVAGVRTAIEAGVPVVSVMPRWSTDAIAPAIRASGIRFGGATGYPAKDGFWDADIALQRPGRETALASMSLMTALMVDAPRSRWAFLLQDGGNVIEALEMSDTPHAEADGGTAVISRRWLRVARVDREDDSKPLLGIERGARKAIVTVAMPSDSAFASATIDYGKLPELSPRELRERIGGRVVLVTVLRNPGAGGEPLYQYPGGRELPGSYIPAATIHGMLGGGWVSPAGAGSALAHAGFFCALSAGVGVYFRRRGWWVVPLAAMASVVVAVATSAGLFASLALFVNPMPTAVASVVASFAAFAGVRPDRNRQLQSGVHHERTNRTGVAGDR